MYGINTLFNVKIQTKIDTNGWKLEDRVTALNQNALVTS